MLTPALAKQIGENASKQAIQQGLNPSQLANVAKDTAASQNFAYNQMTGGERLSNIGSNLFSTDTLDSMASNYMPIAIGGGSLGAQNAQDQYLEDMEQYRLDREKRKKDNYLLIIQNKYTEEILIILYITAMLAVKYLHMQTEKLLLE